MLYFLSIFKIIFRDIIHTYTYILSEIKKYIFKYLKQSKFVCKDYSLFIKIIEIVSVIEHYPVVRFIGHALLERDN